MDHHASLLISHFSILWAALCFLTLRLLFLPSAVPSLPSSLTNLTLRHAVQHQASFHKGLILNFFSFLDREDGVDDG